MQWGYEVGGSGVGDNEVGACSRASRSGDMEWHGVWVTMEWGDMECRVREWGHEVK